MPVIDDPQASVRVVLVEHEDKPESEAPCFWFTAPSRRDTKAIDKILRKLSSINTAAGETAIFDLFDEIEEAIRVRLTRWDNQRDKKGVAVDYDPDELDRLVDDAELSELLGLLRVASLPTVEEKKASGSPSESGAEQSAQPAAAATAQ